MKKIILSFALLCSIPTITRAEETVEFASHEAYMIELYQRIVDFCKTQENPREILVAIPLEWILATGDLPEKLQNRIADIALKFEQEQTIDMDAMKDLDRETIPYTEIIDSRVAASIKELQKLGVKIIALSPSMPVHADAVLARMKKLNLDFTSTALYKHAMPIEDKSGSRIALLKNGVLFMDDYFQSVSVLETILANLPFKVNQLIIASPASEGGEEGN